MALDLKSLQKAVDALERAVKEVHSGDFMDSLTPDQQEVVKAGVIQNFEFTYELCWKFIRRWIRINLSPDDAEPRTRKDLFRTAARYGLIEDPVHWFEYTEARNITFHIYDEVKAESVFEIATQFIHDAKKLLKELEARND